jgi:hypothetical protein
MFDGVVRLTDDVCGLHLNAEYAALCRELAVGLARKRPTPLSRGHIETWACGIAFTIANINFLFDPGEEPHMSACALCAEFRVSQTTAAARSKEIMRLLRIAPLDPRWSLPSKLTDSPAAWMIQVNGFIVDAREMPRALQEEACRLGLIPFVPDLDAPPNEA